MWEKIVSFLMMILVTLGGLLGLKTREIANTPQVERSAVDLRQEYEKALEEERVVTNEYVNGYETRDMGVLLERAVNYVDRGHRTKILYLDLARAVLREVSTGDENKAEIDRLKETSDWYRKNQEKARGVRFKDELRGIYSEYKERWSDDFQTASQAMLVAEKLQGQRLVEKSLGVHGLYKTGWSYLPEGNAGYKALVEFEENADLVKQKIKESSQPDEDGEKSWKRELMDLVYSLEWISKLEYPLEGVSGDGKGQVEEVKKQAEELLREEQPEKPEIVEQVVV